MKPIFEYAKTTMAGNKKHEIIKVAQENLYMLKRLNERTSVYNFNKWNKEYEKSQYYKRSHCKYPSIDFYKTQRYGAFNNMLTSSTKNTNKKAVYSQTQYSGHMTGTNSKKRKRFEDFSYKDLQIGDDKNTELGEKEEPKFKNLFDPPNNLAQEQEQEEEKQIGNNKEEGENNDHIKNESNEKEIEKERDSKNEDDIKKDEENRNEDNLLNREKQENEEDNEKDKENEEIREERE